MSVRIYIIAADTVEPLEFGRTRKGSIVQTNETAVKGEILLERALPKNLLDPEWAAKVHQTFRRELAGGETSEKETEK